MSNKSNPHAQFQSFSVAVGAILVSKNDEVLLLLRNTEPSIWAPPGGRLLEGENPKEALIRECFEETELMVNPLALCNTWNGMHKGAYTIAIFYLARYESGIVKLSDEHLSFKWFRQDELTQLVASSQALGPINIYTNALQLKHLINFDEGITLC